MDIFAVKEEKKQEREKPLPMKKRKEKKFNKKRISTLITRKKETHPNCNWESPHHPSASGHYSTNPTYPPTPLQGCYT